MKTLLVAINAKYVHSNLAVYTLREYARKASQEVEVAEYTINNYVEDILADIYKKKPEYIGFSCYIWNITYVSELARELKKVLPNTQIWYGGPEVSYNSVDYLKEHSYVDGIMIGEGEETLCELLEYYSNKCVHDLKDIKDKVVREDVSQNINDIIEKEVYVIKENEKSLCDIKGIVTRVGEEIIVTKPRDYIDMDCIQSLQYLS